MKYSKFDVFPSGNTAKDKAQRQLAGRTHYVDDSTLKYFNCRISKCTVTDNGLLCGIVERLPVGSFDADKLYRVVWFDVFGNVVYKTGDNTTASRLTTDEQGYTTKSKAEKVFWQVANELDAEVLTAKGLANELSYLDILKVSLLREFGSN